MKFSKECLTENNIIKTIGYVFLCVSFWGCFMVFYDHSNFNSNNEIWKAFGESSTHQSVSIRTTHFPEMIGLLSIAGAIMVCYKKKEIKENNTNT